jgi:Na+-transporting methylmalonyl-CoA/oxaloacetate decarboxylase gamma subunit
MTDFQTGLQRIVEGQGVPIAIAGMAIVFVALGVIASSIAVMPHVLRWVAIVMPEPAPQVARSSRDDDAALAAVAAAAFHAAHGGEA